MRTRIKKVPATTNNLTKAIVNFLLSEGHFAFRVNNGAVYDIKGGAFRRKGKNDPAISDIIGVLNPYGIIMAIEVKNLYTGDVPTTQQSDFKRQIVDRGGIHHYARTYDGFVNYYHHFMSIRGSLKL